MYDNLVGDFPFFISLINTDFTVINKADIYKFCFVRKFLNIKIMQTKREVNKRHNLNILFVKSIQSNNSCTIITVMTAISSLPLCMYKMGSNLQFSVKYLLSTKLPTRGSNACYYRFNDPNFNYTTTL